MADDLSGREGERAEDATATSAQALVNAARRHLDMDVAFVAEFAGGRRVFRFVDAVPGAVRLEAGAAHELADTYCSQIVDGVTPGVIPDTSAEPSVRDLAVTDQIGIASYVGVPIRFPDGRLYGTLCCLAHDVRLGLDDSHRNYLAVLAEAIAADIERSTRQPGHRDQRREHIRRTIDEHLFFPVYQPIVELTSGRVVGAEALTRFTPDDRGPLAWFAEAATVGLGAELEVATARAAVEAFDAPPDRYLAVNLSPSVMISLAPSASTDLAGTRLVAELTEHTEVADYGTLQAAIVDLRAHGIRLAVDDTGSGVSSLRHILELQPDLIKLDLALTIDIDRDPVRQALAEALATFARKVGADVIAEGIETAAQLETVASLGIPYGQGYHLGRPGPLPLPTALD